MMFGNLLAGSTPPELQASTCNRQKHDSAVTAVSLEAVIEEKPHSTTRWDDFLTEKTA